MTPEQCRDLRRIVSASTSEPQEVFRARIIPELSEGKSHEMIATQLSTSLQTVSR